MNKEDWTLDNIGELKKKRARLVRIVISGMLAFLGLTIIISQFIPIANSFFQGRLMEIRSSSIINPVPDSYKQYIQGEFAYYDPGEGYFQDLGEQARAQYLHDSPSQNQRDVVINKNYSQNMQLSIPSVNINKVNVSPNVESHEEEIYNQYLTSGLAHFKGTPLPGDNGNSFIYGHSAVTSFFDSHPDLPETIFTRLEDVDIGDTIEIFRDGEKLSYTARNKRIVEDDDFSIFQHNSNRETLTLMTCWPVGIGSKRLVVTAEINES